MGLGFFSSVVAHTALLLVAIIVLASPRHIESTPSQPVTVDIVPENEVTEPAKEAPKIDLPREKPADRPAPDASAQANSRDTQGQALAATTAPGGRQNPQVQQQDPFAPGATPKPLYFPVVTPGLEGLNTDFDAPAETAARLSSDDVAALHAHMQRCWKPQARLSQAQNVRAVIRVALNVDGALMADPILVKASASTLGPPLVESAMRAVRQCQPFAFLPPEKYDEWKVLELTFSPQGLSAN
jgi:hypothetical protein